MITILQISLFYLKNLYLCTNTLPKDTLWEELSDYFSVY